MKKYVLLHIVSALLVVIAYTVFLGSASVSHVLAGIGGLGMGVTLSLMIEVRRRARRERYLDHMERQRLLFIEQLDRYEPEMEQER